MIKPQALANAVATVFVVAYVICGIVAFVSPDFLFSIANSWFHAIDLAAVKATTSMGLGTFVFGIVTFGAYIWVLTYAAANLYNKFAK